MRTTAMRESTGRNAMATLVRCSLAVLLIAMVCGVLAGCSNSSDAQSSASVATESQEVPANVSLIASTSVEAYTYDDLQSDIETLESAYPSLVTVRSLGTTADGRELYDLVVGDGATATKKVLFNAGIHAREYRTPQIVMCQAADLCAALAAGDSYNGLPYDDLMQGVAIHIVPMVNPDGIAFAQSGLDGANDQRVKDALASIAASDGASPTMEYFRNWKSNANGVDLNRNFDASWDQFNGTSHPSSERYKGTAPGCEVESAALIELTERERFDCTISYHSHGQVIYWYFGQQGELYDRTLALANAVQEVTGYALDANYENLDPAGYKDWAISKMSIPSLTIEVGTDDSPVPIGQMQGILQRNEYVVEQVLCWLEQ